MAVFFDLARVTEALRDELLGLRWSDADLGAKLLTTWRSVSFTTAGRAIVNGTKAGKVRRVDLDVLCNSYACGP